MKATFFITSLSLILSACSPQQKQEPKLQASPFAHIEEREVAEVLERAVSYAGGWENWLSIKEMTYKKHGRLFLKDSSIESETRQIHTYRMVPFFNANISWQKDSSEHQIIYSVDSISKKVDDKYQEADADALSRSVMSALFVLGMPFKLLDDGVMLSYEGTTMFKDSVESDIIKAIYSSKDHDNHSTDDLWWFYFEKNSGKYIGSKVFHTPTYALIENLGFSNGDIIKFPGHRKSYRVDSLNNIQFLRAEFWYSDYQVSR